MLHMLSLLCDAMYVKCVGDMMCYFFQKNITCSDSSIPKNCPIDVATQFMLPHFASIGLQTSQKTKEHYILHMPQARPHSQQ